MKKVLQLFILLLLLSSSLRLEAQSWSALGTGMNSYINALCVHNGEVYAGGNFTTAGGNNAKYIARWNGSSWSAVGTGVNYVVNALASFNGELYAAGQFDTAGGIHAMGIAKWNGTSWDSLGTGIYGYGNALIIFNNELYVGGNISAVGGVATYGIAKWNGISWTTFGTGATGSGGNGIVYSFSIFNNELYVGGSFNGMNGTSANRIVKWNGATWSALGSGVKYSSASCSVFAISEYNGDIYAGGQFDTAGSIAAHDIAKWNGTSWSVVGAGANADVWSLTKFNNELYAGGGFWTYPGQYKAKWNGLIWTPVGSGSTNDWVWAMMSYNNELYAAGFFTQIGGISANFIAKWNPCAASITASGSISICPGGSVTLNANVGLSYQWLLNGSTIPGATSSSYNVTVIGNYTCIVTTACGTATSNQIVITQNNVPTATINTSGGTILCSGSTLILNSNTGVGLSYQWKLNGGTISGATSSSYSVSVAGIYTCTVTNNCGSTTSNAITVVQGPSIPLVPSTIAGVVHPCPGNTATYSIPAVSGATVYHWTTPLTATITSGQGTTNITVNLASSFTSGIIRVTAGNICGNSGPSSKPISKLMSCPLVALQYDPFRYRDTSLIINKNIFDVKLYPNPSNNHFTIQIISPTNSEGLLVVYDLIGKVVETKENIINGEEVIFGNHLENGIYFVRIETGDGVVVRKLIKE